MGHWEYLEPCVRAHFVRRICVVGAESTGTTTLASDLAEFYGTTWVPEYGRQYYEAKLAAGTADSWSTDDFVDIAREQQRLEDAAARVCGPLLVCDTDALATSIWHERYLRMRSPDVEAIAAQRGYALYLLTDCDIPFVQDGTRDGERVRRWMTGRFKEALSQRPEPWVLLCGSRAERLQSAIRALRERGLEPIRQVPLPPSIPPVP